MAGILYGVSIGGTGGATVASQTSKYAKPPIVRQFSPGMPGALAAGVDSTIVDHYSFKCNSGDKTGMAAGTYDSAIVTHLRSLAAGLNVKYTYYHEPEDDGWTAAQWKAAANHFFHLVRTTTGVVANVQSVLVLMASTVLGWNGRHIADWWPTTDFPDLIGFDFDGPIVPAKGPYPDMTSWMATAAAFAAQKGVGWCVPEFGGDVISSDSSHAGRAAWLTSSAQQFADAGAQYVIYFDSGTEALTQTNEINAWKALVAQTPPTTPAAPTGITVTPADDGLSATLGWAALPGGVDHVDAYLQGPGDTFPHKLNTAGPIAVTPRAYTFPTVPGTTYDPGSTLAAAGAPSGTPRSGFGALVKFTAPKPGPTNHAPIIVSAVPTQDATNPQLWHLAAVCTDPDGNTMTYQWVFTYLLDSTVPTVTLPAASGDVTLPANGGWGWTFTVTDSGGLSNFHSDSVSVNASPSAYTDYVNAQMLQHREAVEDMAFIEQQSKPLFDAAIKANAYRRSPHNARHRLVGSNYDPGNQSGSTVVTPAAKDFWFTTLLMEGDTIAHLRTFTGRAQIGSGALGAFFDADSGIINPDVVPFSIDAWLTQNPSPLVPVDMDLPQPITQIIPGALVGFGMWFPNTGISQMVQFHVRPAGGAQSYVPALGIFVAGVVTNLSAMPTSVNLTALAINPEPFVGVPQP